MLEENEQRVALNLSMNQGQKDEILALAKANRMETSALIRFLMGKVHENPQAMGLSLPQAPKRKPRRPAAAAQEAA